MPIAPLIRARLRLASRSLAMGGTTGATARVLATSSVLLCLGALVSPLSYVAATRHGEAGVTAVFGCVHIAWLAASVVFGRFGEGFPLRTMLSYPVRTWVVHCVNVLAFPVDVVAWFFMPSLVAVVAGVWVGYGPSVGVVTAGAVVLLVALTAGLFQLMLVSIESILRHDWVRALGGSVMMAAGLVFSVLVNHLRSEQAERLVEMIGVGLMFLPTVAAPARTATSAIAGEWTGSVLTGVGSVFIMIALVWLGATISTLHALNDSRASRMRGRSDTRVPVGRLRWWLRVKQGGSPILRHELRMLARSPDRIVRLVVLPVMIGLFLGMRGALDWAYVLAFWMSIGMIECCSNQFGHDGVGVRTYYVLPVHLGTVVLGKNQLCMVVAIAQLGLSLSCAAIIGLRPDGLEGAIAILGFATAIPVLLVVGNRVSMLSALPARLRISPAARVPLRVMILPYCALIVVIVSIALPVLVIDAISQDVNPVLKISILIIPCLLAWLLWRLKLPKAADELAARGEILIARLSEHSDGL